MENFLMKYSDFQFIQPLLTKAHFDMLPIEGEPESEISVSLKKNILRLSGEKKAIVRLSVCLNHDSKERKNIPFVAEVEMQCIFTWNRNIEENEIHKFLNQNAVALLISYIRPIVAILTASSPLPSCNLPFINITDH